ncbi:hypothetical protein [Nitrososphaera sp.]|uniref:hypothetical protein n=1 Tax=Nitrososphaera sp. TaxID=1971748 RepID=UPI002ED99F86
MSFKVTGGEITLDEDTYSVVSGKANLAVISGRLGITEMLEDPSGKTRLLRITA